MPELPRPLIVLVDGYALAYRAFFAMIARPLTTSRGENASAAWGVTNFLLRLVEEYRPDYLAWVHDAGTSFRTKVYPEYKATREKLDEELQDAFERSVERIEQLLDAFNVPLVAVDGYEADDVIGTLAKRADAAGLHVMIVSGDKDFYQLISPRISLLNPGRGGPAAVAEEVVTQENAADRLGVAPNRIVDFLALVGDTSDNVPGVRGIGEKTARKLIETYGDLDTILARSSEVTGKRAREALLVEAANARLSRELVTIHCDVPAELDLATLERREPDGAALQRLFAELEFHSLMDRVPAPARTDVGTRYAVVERVDHVPKVMAAVRDAALAAIDVRAERLGAHRGELIGLAIAVGDARAWYLPLGHRAPEGELINSATPPNLPPAADPALRPLVQWLEDPKALKAGHDIKGTWLTLRRVGIDLAGVVYDAKIASFLLNPGKRSHELADLMLEHLGAHHPRYAEVVGTGRTRRPFAEVALPAAGEYCCAEADAVLRLRTHFAPLLAQSGLEHLLCEVEIPLVRVLVDMEWRGIKLDRDRLAELSRELLENLGQLERSIYAEAGTDFNINSTRQLRHVLFEKLQLPVVKRTKTGPSTDAAVLAELALVGFAVPQLLMEYRELEKLRSTYLEALPRSVDPETGRVHTSFHQTGAATGRLSSSDPNLQNIPVRTERGGRIRTCFVPESGERFVVADYSQVELRVLAHLSGDEAFVGAFRRDGDIHRETAALVFEVAPEEVTPEMRARAKTINFATIYGQGAFSLARQLRITQEEAKAFIERYFARLAGVRAFLDRTIEEAKTRGYVETLFGRRRYIPELHDKNYNIRAFGERTAMNSPIQGSAADIIKIAMIRLDHAMRAAGVEQAILLQVHDELLLEVPEPEVDRVVPIVREAMEGAAELDVPLVVDIGVGANWLDAKS